MDYDYKKRGHHKIFRRNKIIYKFFKNSTAYDIEKKFYLLARCSGDVCCCCCSSIPKLYYYSDSRLLMILENVGKSITPIEFNNNIDKIYPIYKKIHNDTGYYQNDMYNKNVCKKNDKYYIIDFEKANPTHKFTNSKFLTNNSFYKKYY